MHRQYEHTKLEEEERQERYEAAKRDEVAHEAVGGRAAAAHGHGHGQPAHPPHAAHGQAAHQPHAPVPAAPGGGAAHVGSGAASGGGQR